MEAYLISSSQQIPSRKKINRITYKERADEKKTMQMLCLYLPAVLIQIVNSYRIRIPCFYPPGESPLSYDECGYREFLFDLACWWFESAVVNLAQFLQAAEACLWMIRTPWKKQFFFFYYQRDGEGIVCAGDDDGGASHLVRFVNNPKVITCKLCSMTEKLSDLAALFLESAFTCCNMHKGFTRLTLDGKKRKQRKLKKSSSKGFD
jgi:hypothetical protein